MHVIRPAVVAALALVTPSLFAQNSLFMKIDSILGDAQDPFHLRWIQLSEFTLSAGALDPNTQVFNFQFSYPLDVSFVPLLEAQQAQQVFNRMDVHTVESNNLISNTLILRDVQLGPLTLNSDSTGLTVSGSVIGLDRLTLEYQYLDPTSLTGRRKQVTQIDYSSGTSFTALVSALDGDYNADGVVAQDDHSAWAGLFGTNNLVADGNRDGVVDIADYTVW